jgi:hypothetical protein
MLDVLEHLPRPVETLTRLHRAALPGARLVILVPAMQCLWSKWDEVLGHQRRYEMQSLHADVTAAGWRVERSQYIFNAMAGIVKMRGLLFKKGTLRETEFPRVGPAFNQFLIMAHLLEMKIPCFPFGTSLAMLAQKAGA